MYITSAVKFAISMAKQYASKAERARIVELIGNTVCQNQGMLSEYSFLAAEKHRALKDSYQEMVSSGNMDLDRLGALKKDLERHVFDGCVDAAKFNFERIVEYFSTRSAHEVRVCLKGVNGRDEVVDPSIRSKPGCSKTPNHSIDVNKGFKEARRTGEAYLENNVPSAVKNSNYANFRLNGALALAYKPPFAEIIRSRLSDDFIDWNWRRCWKSVDDEDASGDELPPTDSCYKSTMIIPMTLIGNRLTPDFRRKFNIPQKVDLSKKKWRAIYGFICIDHRNRKFFDPSLDKAIGYIFSDFLCIYTVHRLVYTERSKTFNEVRAMLKGS